MISIISTVTTLSNSNWNSAAKSRIEQQIRERQRQIQEVGDMDGGANTQQLALLQQELAMLQAELQQADREPGQTAPTAQTITPARLGRSVNWLA